MDKWIKDIISTASQDEWGYLVAEYLKRQPQEKWDDLLKNFFSHLCELGNVNTLKLIKTISLNLGKPSVFLEAMELTIKLYTPSEKKEAFPYATNITKKKILDAALKVFSSKGYHDATMEDIARVAEVGKGTVYRHFKSKENLYRQMIDFKLEELNSEIQSIIAAEDDVLKILWECISVYMQFFEQNRGLYRLILSEDIESAGSKYVKRAFRSLYPLKRKLFEAAKKGRFKPLNFETTFYGFMGFLHGIVQKWLDHNCNYSLLKEVPTVAEILLYGVVKRNEELN